MFEGYLDLLVWLFLYLLWLVAEPVRYGKVVIVWDIQIMSLWILCLNYQEQK